MSPLVQKEVRLLAPGCITAAVVIFFIGLVPNDVWRDNVWGSLLGIPADFLYLALLIKMSLGTFGSEMSNGTLSNLLSQPISRARIWRTKISVLGLGFLLLGVAVVAGDCLHFHLYHRPLENPRVDGLGTLIVAPLTVILVMFSGGLWAVLLLRQVAAAFWFVLLIPLAILMAVTSLTGQGLSETPRLLNWIFIGYSVAGFFFARWLFFRAQDTQWTGGTISFPEMRGFFMTARNSAARRAWHPRLALIGKEFQLHQSQVVIAGCLVLFHLGVMVYRHLKSDLARHPDLQFILNSFWLLWLFLPLLIGCAAVAEERKLGTLEAQLCLPVKRRVQFTLKLAVVLALSILLGAVLPLLLEGTRIVLPSPIKSLTLGFLILAGIAATIGALAFYASSLVRNTLQSLAPAAFILFAGTILLRFAYEPDSLFHHSFWSDSPGLWRGWLVYWIGGPVIVLTLLRLTFRNYQRTQPTGKLWRQNILTLLAAFAFVTIATTAVYHRAWESFTPFEPSHGVARLSRADNVILSHDIDTMWVRLPDGRIWLDYFYENNEPGFGAVSPLSGRPFSLTGGYFLEGSNWVSAAQSWTIRQLMAVKGDGTLWISQRPFKLSTNSITPEKLEQFGDETNWQGVAFHYQVPVLLKTDGTLWSWSITVSNFANVRKIGLQTHPLSQLGTESNWAGITPQGEGICLRKKDGTVWLSAGNFQNFKGETNDLGHGLVLSRMESLEGIRFLSTAVAEVRNGDDYRVGVRADGTFRIWAYYQVDPVSRYMKWTATDSQIGNQTNWLGVAGYDQKIVLLKNDGSLWLWDVHSVPNNNWLQPDVSKPSNLPEPTLTRLSKHSDWIAITYEPNGVASLAADGTLWYWPLRRPQSDFGVSEKYTEPLIDFSRKPQKLANIFNSPKTLAANQ